MKRKTHLHTEFVKFIIEKYKDGIQILSDDENETQDEIQGAELRGELQDDEVQNEDEPDDFEEMVKEYNQLQKKLRTKGNGRIHSKRQK